MRSVCQCKHSDGLCQLHSTPSSNSVLDRRPPRLPSPSRASFPCLTSLSSGPSGPPDLGPQHPSLLSHSPVLLETLVSRLARVPYLGELITPSPSKLRIPAHPPGNLFSSPACLRQEACGVSFRGWPCSPGRSPSADPCPHPAPRFS